VTRWIAALAVAPDPPPSNRVAGASVRHAPLASSTGTSVITGRDSVHRGAHRAECFDQKGPRRLSLFTWAGLVNGRYTKTTVVVAEPVLPETAVSQGPIQ